MIQLDFFEEKSAEDSLREEFRAVKASADKVRKGIYAKHGELAKQYLELNQRLEILERHICKGIWK